MMVAWHEVPGNRPVKIRPVGYGMIVSPPEPQPERIPAKQASPHTVPYGTDSRPRGSRLFAPGYHHLVPPGQKSLRFSTVCQAMILPALRASKRRYADTPTFHHGSA